MSEVAKFETVIKETIARGARRQVRLVVLPLRRDLLRLRRKMGGLQGAVAALRRRAPGWERLMKAAPPVTQVSEEEAKAARLSPHQLRRTGKDRAMAGFRCVKCGKVAMAQKVCCGRPMKKA